MYIIYSIKYLKLYSAINANTLLEKCKTAFIAKLSGIATYKQNPSEKIILKH
jgi:hypothetical protein